MQVLQAVDVVADGRLPGPGPSVVPVHVIGKLHPFRVLRVLQVDAHVIMQRPLAALGARTWLPPASVTRPAVSRRVCIASAVTVRPRNSSSPAARAPP